MLFWSNFLRITLLPSLHCQGEMVWQGRGSSILLPRTLKHCLELTPSRYVNLAFSIGAIYEVEAVKPPSNVTTPAADRRASIFFFA